MTKYYISNSLWTIEEGTYIFDDRSKRTCFSLQRKMNDAVTIIVGAGAVFGFWPQGHFPSVKNITDEVLKLSIQKVEGDERPLQRELYDHVVKKLNRVSEANHIKPPLKNSVFTNGTDSPGLRRGSGYGPCPGLSYCPPSSVRNNSGHSAWRSGIHTISPQECRSR